MKIIHISDTHIGNKDKLKLITNSITKYIPKKWPDAFKGVKYVIITGDFVQDFSDNEFNLAVELIITLQKNGYTVLAVPGNHDYCGGYCDIDHYPHYPGRKDFIKYILKTTNQPGEYPQVIEDGNTEFILLDSEECGHNYHGKLGVNQLCRLKNLLNKCPEPNLNYPNLNKKIVVALHHHPFRPSETDDGGLDDEQQFLEIIGNKVDCLLFGHAGPIVQETFDREEKMYGIPIINEMNMEDMKLENGKISVIDLDNNTVTGYPTDITKTPENLDGYVREGVHITPIVTTGYPVVYNCLDAAPCVKFKTSDTVTMIIGGCVQAGGKWGEPTWRRYVNPITEDSKPDNMHYGKIHIPGITEGLTPISELVKKYGTYDYQSRDKCTLTFKIPNIHDFPESDRFLKLQYKDDEGFCNNGYWGGDNDFGPGNQCLVNGKNVGPAYVDITIRRNTESAWLPLLLD